MANRSSTTRNIGPFKFAEKWADEPPTEGLAPADLANLTGRDQHSDAKRPEAQSGGRRQATAGPPRNPALAGLLDTRIDVGHIPTSEQSGGRRQDTAGPPQNPALASLLDPRIDVGDIPTSEQSGGRRQETAGPPQNPALAGLLDNQINADDLVMGGTAQGDELEENERRIRELLERELDRKHWTNFDFDVARLSTTKNFLEEDDMERSDHAQCKRCCLFHGPVCDVDAAILDDNAAARHFFWQEAGNHKSQMRLWRSRTDYELHVLDRAHGKNGHPPEAWVQGDAKCKWKYEPRVAQSTSDPMDEDPRLAAAERSKIVKGGRKHSKAARERHRQAKAAAAETADQDMGDTALDDAQVARAKQASFSSIVGKLSALRKQRPLTQAQERELKWAQEAEAAAQREFMACMARLPQGTSLPSKESKKPHGARRHDGQPGPSSNRSRQQSTRDDRSRDYNRSQHVGRPDDRSRGHDSWRPDRSQDDRRRDDYPRDDNRRDDYPREYGRRDDYPREYGQRDDYPQEDRRRDDYPRDDRRQDDPPRGSYTRDRSRSPARTYFQDAFQAGLRVALEQDARRERDSRRDWERRDRDRSYSRGRR